MELEIDVRLQFHTKQLAYVWRALRAKAEREMLGTEIVSVSRRAVQDNATR